MTRLLPFAIALAVLTLSGRVYIPSHPRALAHPHALVPPSILWGVAAAESDGDPRALSHDGRDRGLFQLRRDFDEYRGVVDPFDPLEAMGHAQRILWADYRALGRWDKAITAYAHGRTWTRIHGVDREYVRRVYDR